MTSVPIQLIDGLAFVVVTLYANGETHVLERVLVDTGSAATLFKTDDLAQLGVIPLPTDPLRIMRGIGGEEAVFEKQIDALQVGPLIARSFNVQMGAVDYGLSMDGILGLDYLLATGAILDLHTLQLHSAD